MNNDSLKVGDVVEVTTERLAYGGDAVARVGGLAVFIPLAAPGERLRVRVVERKKNFARGAIEEIIAASPSRRVPACQFFGECGGCQLQHLSYDAQLQAKAAFVRDALLRVGHIDWPHEISVRHSSEFGYRNRAQIKLAQAVAGETRRRAIGFNRAGSHSICDVDSCPILAPELNDALQSLRSSVSDEVYEVEMAVGESGVSFEPALQGLNAGMVERRVCGAIYRFSAATFFQVNSLLLDDLIEEAIGESAGDLAIDLYAGVGLFTIQLARRFDKVIGVESSRRATAFARDNVQANSLLNIKFINGRVEQWLDAFVKRRKNKPSPDFLLLDPPRSGAAAAISHVSALSPANISYVSCDPATLARDLRQLIDSGYELQRVAAVDLFPQTYHVETVARLKKR